MLPGVPGWFRVASLLISCTSIGAAEVVVAGRVIDDNGMAVSGARVDLRSPGSEDSVAATSDAAGNFNLQLERPGEYNIRAERQGFFVFTGKSSEFREGPNQLTITLNHLQEFVESVDVTYSPPAIDLQQPSDRKELVNVEILTVPYPAPQDLRNAFPLFNGVVQDVEGHVHFNGGATDQTNFTLDGFNLSDPVTGRLEARISIDAVQTLELESSRFSPEKGRGSAGSLDLKTKMGDDRWRFGGTNFVPGISSEDGLHVKKWSPGLEFSGPIARGRAWFHNGFDAFYDVDTVSGLPHGQNRARGLTLSNLSRFQVNLTPANLLTGSLLLNYVDLNHRGLSFLDPLETTTNWRQNLYLYTLRDQMYFHSGALVEFGFAGSRGVLRQAPQGSQTYEISPFGRFGNYFVNLGRHMSRQQWVSNVFLPAMHALGSHEFKFGVDVERESFCQAADRHDYRVLRNDLSTARYVTFAGNRLLARSNFQVSQYILDRWTPRDGLLIEGGFRLDWDEVVRDVVWSPRLSLAYAPKWLRDTKFSAGFGVFHDALTLGTITQHLDQVSYATLFQRNGTVLGPFETAFLVNERDLRLPRYRTLSFTVERKLPLELYGKVAYTHKAGSRGLTFVNDLESATAGIPEGGLYRLRNRRNDRYDALELSVRRTFAGRFEWTAGYTRSSARSNAAVDYSLENPIFARQAPGPFPWDTPNRFLSWGWAPLPKRMLPRSLQFLVRETSVAYLAEYRTGFPFDVVNEDGFLVGRPNSQRFPSYFNINLHFERKFRFFHYLWGWRFGFNNVLNYGNPNVVNNNVDSSEFLTYGRGQLRAFNVRLRLLGKR